MGPDKRGKRKEDWMTGSTVFIHVYIEIRKEIFFWDRKSEIQNKNRESWKKSC